jgi:hypothetical protein
MLLLSVDDVRRLEGEILELIYIVFLDPSGECRSNWGWFEAVQLSQTLSFELCLDAALESTKGKGRAIGGSASN